ncbi:MAG: hypothetical protein IT267_08155 [Saprospiraceae bacterium]|nr:hypothetical protein [Saprospiraceae bacterium]
MNLRKLLYLSIIGMLAFIPSCGEEGTGSDCTGIVSTYSGSAMFVLNKNCAISGCHDPMFKSGGVDYSTYETATLYLKNPNNRFLCSINHEPGCPKMPQDIAPNKMDPADIKVLECWYNNGFPL